LNRTPDTTPHADSLPRRNPRKPSSATFATERQRVRQGATGNVRGWRRAFHVRNADKILSPFQAFGFKILPAMFAFDCEDHFCGAFISRQFVRQIGF
jgi:hypothetical protein